MAGKLKLKAANDDLLATFVLDAPAFGAAAAGIATGAGLPKSTVGAALAGAGTDATKWEITTGADVVIINGNVGTGITVDNPNIAQDQVVNLTTMTYTQPAGSPTVLSTAARNAAVDAVVDLIDA